MWSAVRSWLRRLGATKALAPSAENTEGLIHIHEDDWGMRNLYPLIARAEVSADIETAVAAAEKNRDPSGLGWTDMHVIKPPSGTYVEAGLLLSDAAGALEPFMPRVRRFYASTFASMGKATRDRLGSYEEDAWCFGFSRRCYVKLEPKAEHVERIWFDLGRDTPEHAGALRRALEAIDRLTPSLIADYFLDVVAPVSDAASMDRYFSELSGRFESST
jgi:hypothetical protein